MKPGSIADRRREGAIVNEILTTGVGSRPLSPRPQPVSFSTAWSRAAMAHPTFGLEGILVSPKPKDDRSKE